MNRPDTRTEYSPRPSPHSKGVVPRERIASDLSDPHASRSEAAVRFVLKVLPQIHRAFVRREWTLEHKADASPVTEIDRDVERRLRELIADAFPDDAILGEEHDDRPGTSGYRWILDPIDGTRPFVHGVPLFGSLIAVEHRRPEDDSAMPGGDAAMPVVGVCATGVGDGCRVHEASLQFGDWVGNIYRANGKRLDAELQTRECRSLKEATVCYTQLDLFDDDFQRLLLSRLVKRAGLVRGWGDCFGHMLVCTGQADIMIDTQMSLWDAAALQPIAHAAGAAFFDLEGLDRHTGGSAITCVPTLRDELLELIMQCRAEML